MPHRSTTINANLTKATASIPDVLQLLRLWEPNEKVSEFRVRAVEQNLLGKSSRSRARDLFESVFQRRYLGNGSGRPARLLKRLVAAGKPRDVVDRLLFYHAALTEHVLYRAAVDLVYEHRQRGEDRITKEEMKRFIKALPRSGEDPYSDAVLDKLAQGALTALRDFRLLEGKAEKRIAPVRVPDEVVGYVAYALKEEGHSAKGIVEHEDWRLYLLTPREAEDRIADVGALGHFTYRAAGDIRRFDWAHDTLDEYVEAIASG